MIPIKYVIDHIFISILIHIHIQILLHIPYYIFMINDYLFNEYAYVIESE